MKIFEKSGDRGLPFESVQTDPNSILLHLPVQDYGVKNVLFHSHMGLSLFFKTGSHCVVLAVLELTL